MDRKPVRLYTITEKMVQRMGKTLIPAPYLRNMSRPLRQLMTQTAIYGMSTILVRVLNYLLAPLHTRVFTEQADYGIISELYAYVTFINVICMFGLETAYFRFAAGNSRFDKDKVFGSAQISLISSTVLLMAPLLLFSHDIANILGYPGKGIYVRYFAGIIAFDTLVNIPFARLRQQGRPWRYFLIKLSNVMINIFLNVFFLWPALKGDHSLFDSFGFSFKPEHGVAYVFLANLIASATTFLLFFPGMLRLRFDAEVWKRLIGYGAPLIIIGLAGMINETLDRVLIKYWGDGTMLENLQAVGIYSAVYKLAIFMTLAVQGFRMGAEPFFFNRSSEKNAPLLYAVVMKYFVIACCIIFLCVGMFPDLFRIIIGPAYHAGLHIVPVLLLAQLFLGIYYNQSVWYKLTDKTTFATIIPIFGAILTLVLNWLLIPKYGYAGAAWTTLACYLSMVVLSWFIGQKYYPVPYPLRKIFTYIFLSVAICIAGLWVLRITDSLIVTSVLRLIFLSAFIAFAWWLDLGKLFQKKPVDQTEVSD